MLRQSLDVAVKFCLSFLKSEWGPSDYPVRLRHFPVDPEEDHGRLKPIPWIAQVVNWPAMAGHGDTPEQALADLSTRFATLKAKGSRLPRPGTGLPIVFAAGHRLSEHPDLARDFFRRVLHMNFDECFVSDESSLWDFHTETTNDHYNERILLAYGVDVSDIEDGNLADILERLVSQGASA